MTNAVTQKPLLVMGGDTLWPYITVPLTQLDQVQRLLDSRGVRYRVAENAYSFDGDPYDIDMDLPRGADAASVQAILDSVVEK